MKAFSEALRRFQAVSDKPRIALFRPVKSVNDALYDNIIALLSEKYYIETVNTFFLYSYEAMFKDTFEILMVVESELLIAQDCVRIREFIRRGGALIFGGSNMLMQDLDTKDKQKSYFGEGDFYAKEETLKKYQQSIAKIGIKPYVSDTAPSQVKFDGDFLDGLDGFAPLALYADSAKMNTTSCVRTPQPYAGTCYVERYEVLRNFEVAVGYDALGRRLTTAVDFAQNGETGARVCLFPSNAEGSFLDKNNLYFENMLLSAVKFCLNKVMLTLCESSYACYRDGENPVVEYRIKSYAPAEKAVYAKVQICDGDTVVAENKIHHVILPGEETAGHFIWENAVFDKDYYDIRVFLYEGDTLISKADNAFVVWKEDVVMGGSELFCDGMYFRKNGRRSALLGANYYDSNSGGAMWVYPNIATLNTDFKAMADFGIECVRVHFHHPKWFYDFYMQAYGEVPERYRSLGDSWIMDEKHFRIFDANVYLCQKYRMIHSYDLFTLVPEEMGDPRGWGGVHDYICLDDKIANQKAFLDVIINRYKGIPGLSWDVYNESHHTGLPGDAYHRFAEPVSIWSKIIRDYIHELGEIHPVTAGGYENFLDDDVDAPHDIVDYLTIHTFWQKSAIIRREGFDGPQVYHEAWMNRPFTPDGNLAQMADMRTALINTFRIGMAGFMPWQWTEQLATWQAEGTYYGETWDDMLGCCVHNDGSLKPAGRFYRDFIRLFADIEIDRYADDNRILTSDGAVTFGVPEEVNAGEYYMVYEKAGQAVRGIARGHIAEKDFTLSTDSDDCDVFFDIADDKTVYCKADDACRFTASFGREIRSAVLVDGDKEIPLSAKGNVLDVDLALWQTYYWIRITF